MEFYDKEIEFKKSYDTIRLIVSKEPLNIEGHQVYNCAVSWYCEDDGHLLNEETGKYENIDAQAYRKVLAGIDLELLQSDPEYCEMVMVKLLDKTRVETYLERGLQEKTECPCGKYIGGIEKKENGYKKCFSQVVGLVSHNSKTMIAERKENRERMEEKTKKAIENK